MVDKDEHRFSDACRFKDDYNALQCGASVLQPIAKAFIRNMNRVRGIGIFPIHAVAIAMINEAARVQSVMEQGLSVSDQRLNPDSPQFDQTFFDKVDKARDALIEKWEVDQNRGGNNFFKVGTTGLNTIIRWNPVWAPEAAQTLMALMLIGLWTAFESLAQDVWITAVNSLPNPLANNVMAAPDSELKTGNQSKSLSYSHFAGANFDFRNTMGSLLFAERKVDFQQLKTIRAAYKVAFGGSLEPIFESNQIALSQLEAVRNLFVHKGGIVDSMFIRRMKNQPNMSDVVNTEGEPLFVTGQYVAMMANRVAKACTKLIAAVDEWLTKAGTENESANDDS